MKETLRHLSWASAMLMKKAADGLPQKRFHQIILSLVMVLALIPAVNVQAFTILTQSETYYDGLTQVFTYNGYSYQVTYTNLKGIAKVVHLDIFESEIDLEVQNGTAAYKLYKNTSDQTTANAITPSDLPRNIGTRIPCYCSDIANTANNPVVTIECVHLVKFDANGGSGTMKTMAYDNTTAKNLTKNSFTRTGYTFSGWATTAAGKKAYDDKASYTATGDVTLYAVWTANQYAVTLNNQSATTAGTTSVTATYDAAMPTPLTLPTKTGYTFGGYYSGTNGSGTLYYNADGTSATTWKLTDATTLYAKWTANQYTVTLDNQSATTAGQGSVTTTYDAAMPNITTRPTKTGYTFGGYYSGTNGSGTLYYNADGTSATTWKLTDATTLYAKWTAIPYTITYTLNGGTNASVNPTTYNVESNTITLSAPTKTGYTFTGWTTTGITTPTTSVTIAKGSTGDRTYTANWTINTYTVTFNANGGSDVASQKVNYEGKATTPAAPTRTGYTFSGWYSDNALTNTIDFATYTVTGDVTLYAKWTANQYTVTLDDQSATTAGQGSVNATYDAAMTKLSTLPAKTGYTFGGYYSEINGGGTKYYKADGTSATTWNIAAATTLYAKWTAKQYTVTLDDQSATTAGQGSVTATYDAALPNITTLPVKTRYTFGGYYSEINGGGTQYYKADGTSATTWNIAAATTLYAKWTVIQYTITWKNEDGTTLEEDKLDYGTTISYNGATPTKTAQSGITYTFNGWSPTLTEGATVTGDATYTATYNMTLNLPTETINGVNYYEISKQEDWDAFSTFANAGANSINGILTDDVYLGDDQTMIGTSSVPFAGIFDGNGKTLNVSYNGSTDMMAPFSVVNGATIRNLKADGTVTSTGNYASGLVGAAGSAVLTISNCEVSSVISSPNCGGFIGHGQTSTSTITNSIFSGALTATAYGGCFVGWEGSTCKITIQNCLSVPYAVSEDTSNDFVCTQNGGTASVTNSYSYGTFTNTQGTAEDKTTMKGGKIARLLNGGDGTTENATGVWGQTPGTDTHPVFMTANDANAVYCVTVGNTKMYGNANSTIALSAANAIFDDKKITTIDKITDGTTTYSNIYTFPKADKTLTYVVIAEDDMSTHTETGTDGKTYYQISTPVQMKWFEYYVDKSTDNIGTCAKLMNDINLSSVCSATAGNWTPIVPNGDKLENWYKGTFDGNGKTISNLYINATTQYQGLFGITNDGCIIKDLHVTGNVTATNYKNVALLVGYNCGKIIRCTSSGTVSGNTYTGGIAGENLGNILQCVNNATVNGVSDPIGGIAAYCRNGSIIDCANFGTVKTKKNNYTYTGGIVGLCFCNRTSIISNNLSMGQVYVADVLTEAYPILGSEDADSDPKYTITDNYYLSASTTAATYGTPKTAAEIAATATMASLLQGSQTDEEYWIADPTQTAYPMLKCFAKAAQVTKSDDLAATYYNTLAWTIPSGMKVYTVNSATSGFANATEYTTGTVVPAGTAVVISGAAGSYQLNFDRTSTAAAVSGNLLRGSDLAATTTATDLANPVFYKFAMNSANEASSLGFYYGATGGVAFTSNAHKAYLPVSSQGGTAKGYILSFGDEPTGISSLPDDTTESGAWYTISGIRLSKKPTTGGLYINNGKKVIIK